MKTLFQGAEATIKADNSKIYKIREKKSYRIPQLDEKIRSTRTKKEARLLEKAFMANIPVPKVLEINEKTSTLVLENLKGKKLADCLDKSPNKHLLVKQLGEIVAKLHDTNIIHGDLTTSNFILVKDKLYVIDFGLGFSSDRVEDKATDLHVLKEALEARHFQFANKLWSSFIIGYKNSKNSKKVLTQLKKVELRGRYKAQY